MPRHPKTGRRSASSRKQTGSFVDNDFQNTTADLRAASESTATTEEESDISSLMGTETEIEVEMPETEKPKISVGEDAENPTEKLKRLWPDWVRPTGEDPARPARIYADGIFDMFHVGHAKCLEQAKKLLPHSQLIVGVCNDADTFKFKGKTVFGEQDRYESIRHCRWADEVVEDAPWVLTPEFMVKHRIDFVAHDALPYGDASGTAAGGDVYQWLKDGGRFLETQRTPGISTSDIILRILKDYNDYVLRNLKRGYSRKDLGVGLLKEKQLRAKDEFQNLSSKVKEQQRRMASHTSRYARRQVQMYTRMYDSFQKELTKQTTKQVTYWQNELHGMQVYADRYMHNVSKNVESVVRQAFKPMNDAIAPLIKPRKTRKAKTPQPQKAT